MEQSPPDKEHPCCLNFTLHLLLSASAAQLLAKISWKQEKFQSLLLAKPLFQIFSSTVSLQPCEQGSLLHLLIKNILTMSSSLLQSAISFAYCKSENNPHFTDKKNSHSILNVASGFDLCPASWAGNKYKF